MKKNLMKEAHKLTKEIKEKYPEVDYKTQLGLCLSFLASKEEEEMTVEEISNKVNNLGKDLPVDVEANEWQKGNYHRIYVNMFWTVKGSRSKFNEWRKGAVGYFTVEDNEVVAFTTQEKGAKYSSSVSAEIIEKCESLVA